MERLKILDLSFYDPEISNSSQVQGGALATGLATSFGASITVNIAPAGFSIVNTPTGPQILATAGGSASLAAAGIAVGAVADNGFVNVFASTFVKTA
ncbi:MAG: hypothetical protein KME60_18880 [Cyanomargarita calcarea GSE-NOS-MK-12-04C]|uniref:Uncharacterized protein n=1 Tax=Cyanomargarita calcarea GSE-NOS-MK-12-04C TaxID=2839659 RepID=A0A951QPU4_9CYAN|nr:hypothetical protein [Cyanomargarita calcarea GSE-NOS-MK-12-04C]